MAIRIDRVCKQFNTKVVLDEFCLDLYQGQITAILGTNSTGKSTLINVIIGNLQPTSGRVVVNTRNGYLDTRYRPHLAILHANLGICFQENVLFEDLTVLEHLQFFARIKGTPIDKLDDEVSKLLCSLELEHLKDTLPKKLSGGEKRKLCISLAIVGQSKVIVLDEPDAGVDNWSRRKVWSTLQSIKHDKVILISGHHLHEVDIFSDCKVFIVGGKVVCVGSSTLIKKTYGGDYYYLRVNLDTRQAELQKLQDFIVSCIASAALHRRSDFEAIFKLPKEVTHNFPAFFTLLDQKIKQKKLKIKNKNET